MKRSVFFGCCVAVALTLFSYGFVLAQTVDIEDEPPWGPNNSIAQWITINCDTADQLKKLGDSYTQCTLELINAQTTCVDNEELLDVQAELEAERARSAELQRQIYILNDTIRRYRIAADHQS